MALKETVMVFLLLSVFPWDCSSDSDFVNPSDLLNFDPSNIRMTNKIAKHAEKDVDSENEKRATGNENLTKSPPTIDASIVKSESNVKTENQCTKWEESALKSIFKRFLVSLVRHIETRVNSHDVPVDFCMKMKVTYSDMMLLKFYGTGDTDNVHEVHEKLEKIVLYPTDLPDESPVYWLEKKIGLSSDFMLKIIVILGLFIFIARMLSLVRITRSLLTKGFLIAFILSSISSFIELYQKKVADQEKVRSEEITNRCPQLSENTLSRFIGYLASAVTFQDEACREFYESTVVNPFFQVSLLEAGAIAITKTIVAPLKILGVGLKEFLVGLLKDLPSQYAAPLFIIMLALIIVLPFLIRGYTLRIPFVLTLSPPPPAQSSLPQAETTTANCPNCIKYKNTEVNKIEDGTSLNRIAPSSTVNSAVMPALERDSSKDYKTTSMERNSLPIDGDSGDQKQIAKKSTEGGAQKLEKNDMNNASLPLLNDGDTRRTAEKNCGAEDCDSPKKIKEKCGGDMCDSKKSAEAKCGSREINNNKDKECIGSPEGNDLNARDMTPLNEEVLSTALAMDENMLSNSNFFLDHESRPGDEPSENGSNVPS